MTYQASNQTRRQISLLTSYGGACPNNTHSYHNHNTEDMAINEVATTDHTIIIIMYMQLDLDIG